MKAAWGEALSRGVLLGTNLAAILIIAWRWPLFEAERELSVFFAILLTLVNLIHAWMIHRGRNAFPQLLVARSPPGTRIEGRDVPMKGPLVDP
jgi:hypothetical protein